VELYLTCNHTTNPLGIDSNPAFSWRSDAGAQKAYRICVASCDDRLQNGNFDWDSGKVDSDRSQYIEYEGKPLSPRKCYVWQVTVWNTDKSVCEEQGTFETGKRDEKWSARWIAADHHRKPDDSVDAPYLRKTFALATKPANARLYICSPGYFDAYLNGNRVIDEELATPFTKYDARLLYSTYDVTDLLTEGDNALGALIGNGWYNCFTQDVWNSKQASWRHIAKLIAELHIEFEDGSHQVVVTDSSWKGAPSPIVFNGIRNGEHFDARLTQSGWDAAGFDDTEWASTKVVRPTGGKLLATEMEPIRITQIIEPVKDWQTREGAYVFDAGQNVAGIAEITVDGADGDEVVIKYSEKLQEDGVNIWPGSVSGFVRSGEFQTDRFFPSGNGPETWRPRFVYHGFQYIEVSGCTNKPKVKAVLLHTDVGSSGELVFENDSLNALQAASRLAILTNLHGLPTDDPHREKNAWTGDVSVSAEAMLLNFHTTPLLRKWLTDVRDAQKPDGALPCVVPSTGWGYNWGNGPDWSSALTHIPWQIYLYTGDERILHENYEAIKRHFGYMDSMAEDGIVHYGIGDWCAPFEGKALAVNMSSFKCPTEVTDTGYYYNAADTISRMARILDLPDDEHDYRAAAVDIKSAFRREFYDSESHTVAGDCQTATACMLYHGLQEDAEHDAILNRLLQQIEEKDHHQDTGILGNKYIYNVLGEAGRMDVAMRMVLNDTYPSFKNWMDLGATTLWECWNGEGSQNHHMFSDISASMYKYLAGIQPDECNPGFGHIRLNPGLNSGLPSVSCAHDSPYGKIQVSWVRSGGSASLDLGIPSGCHATLDLPKGMKTNVSNEIPAGEHQLNIDIA